MDCEFESCDFSLWEELGWCDIGLEGEVGVVDF